MVAETSSNIFHKHYKTGLGNADPVHTQRGRDLILVHIIQCSAGESNGKLPPRTCPGCSVPEPYRSHDWALVPAKAGLQG